MMTSLKILSTHWTDHLGILNLLTIIGFTLGLLVGYSQFNFFLSQLFTFLYSVLIIPFIFGLTYKSDILWLNRYESLGGRISSTINQLSADIKIEDPILFLLLLALLIWFTSFYGGFLLTRTSNPWFPIFISAVTIFVTEFYYQGNNNLYSAFFVFFVLIFITQINFINKYKDWRTKKIPIDQQIGSLTRRASFIFVFLLILFAWNGPNIVSAFHKGSAQQKQVLKLLDDIQNKIAKFTAPIEGTTYVRSEFLGSSIDLGTGTHLSDEIILEISVDQKKPAGSRYYWRARSFDNYMDGEWKSSIDNFKLIEANKEITDLYEYFLFPERKFSIKTRINLGLLYTPPNPQQINRPVKAFFQPLPDNKADYLSMTLEEIIFSGENYEVFSRIPTPTIAQMRESTKDYPLWVTEKYLQIPENLNSRIKNLAESITKEYSTPYDKTLAITNYLRKNIQYQETIITPPVNIDPIEWFLFDYKSGFCNYYATAEVLLLRSIGIPARIVFGYAQGQSQNKEDTLYIIRRTQSHSWPEVFFADIGWVEFEPTTIQPVLNRLPGETVAPISEDTLRKDLTKRDLPLLDGGDKYIPENNFPKADGAEEPEISIKGKTVDSPIPFIFMGLFILYSIYLVYEDTKLPSISSAPIILETIFVKRGWTVPEWIQNWADYAKSSIEQKAFKRIAWSLRLFNQQLPFSYTPAELVDQYKKLFPEMSSKADRFLNEYQRAAYSAHAVNSKLLQHQGNKVFQYAIRKKIDKTLRLNKNYS